MGHKVLRKPLSTCEFNSSPTNRNFHVESFFRFFQFNNTDKLKDVGLSKVFDSFFPFAIYDVKKNKKNITDKEKSNIQIVYSHYEVVDPVLTEEECVLRNITYAFNLKMHIIIKDLTDGTNKSYSGFMGEIPMITKKGTFIVNGHERIFIPQLQRCPGVLFLKEVDPVTSKPMITAKLYPNVGAWLFMTLENGCLYVSVDKRKKFPLTTFLLCFPRVSKKTEGYVVGFDIKEILDSFYNSTEIKYQDGFWTVPFDYTKYQKYPFDVHGL